MKRAKKTIIVCVVLAALLFLAYFLLSRGYRAFMKQMYPIKYPEIVSSEAVKNKLDPALVYSVIKAESNFQPDVTSHAGAVGLMQLTPDTFAWLQTKVESSDVYTANDLRTPAVNIRYGCSLLSLLLDKYSSKRTALSAYNAGIGTVNAWLKDPAVSKDGATLDRIPYAETRKYVDAVLNNYNQYHGLYKFNSKGELVND